MMVVIILQYGRFTEPYIKHVEVWPAVEDLPTWEEIRPEDVPNVIDVEGLVEPELLEGVWRLDRTADLEEEWYAFKIRC